MGIRASDDVAAGVSWWVSKMVIFMGRQVFSQQKLG
jgi:hypothetical protein